MGVGNWSWRSSSGRATTVVHVDGLLESFEDYRKRANASLAAYVEEHYADRVEPGDVVDIEWARDHGLLDVVEAAIGDEFPLWDQEEAYARENAENRYWNLAESVTSHLQTGALQGMEVWESGSQMARAAFDGGARVIACTPLTQVVMREWESSIYLGVGPSDALENTEDFPQDKDVEKFIAKCCAACDPRSTAFYLAADKRPAPVELTRHEIMRVAESRRYPHLHGAMTDVLAAVVGRITAQAEVLEEGGNASYNDQLAFFNDFGIAPDDLLLKKDLVQDMIAFLEDHKATPGMANAAYETEFEQLSERLMTALAINGEEPYRPTTAWTSKRVDMSPYRMVSVMHLEDQAARMAVYGQDNLLAVMSGVKPGCVSVMREADFVKHVAHAVTAQCPVERVHLNGGMATLMTASAADPDLGSILVWRGRPEWGHFAQIERNDALWIEKGGVAQLTDLPSWMKQTVDGHGIRSELDALKLPEGQAASFYDSRGDLTVTGVLSESVPGGNVFVTSSDLPLAPEAQYRAVVYQGAVVQAPAPAQKSEVTYG